MNPDSLHHKVFAVIMAAVGEDALGPEDSVMGPSPVHSLGVLSGHTALGSELCVNYLCLLLSFHLSVEK